jgi:hypothetical protein
MEFPMRHALGSLVAAGIAAGLLASPAGPAHANGSFTHHPDVRVFTPTPSMHEPAAPVVPAARPVKVVVHVVLDALALHPAYRAALAWEYRKDRIHRAFGHRYTGFIKMYRGPRYPL